MPPFVDRRLATRRRAERRDTSDYYSDRGPTRDEPRAKAAAERTTSDRTDRARADDDGMPSSPAP